MAVSFYEGAETCLGPASRYIAIKDTSYINNPMHSIAALHDRAVDHRIDRDKEKIACTLENVRKRALFVLTVYI